MRRLWDGLGVVLAALFGVAGCASSDVALQRPKHPEEINVPPESDSKFSQPPKYPDGYLNKDMPGKNTDFPNGPNGPPGAGGLNGMGGRSGGMSGPNYGAGGVGGRGY
jgi:hypothetical protein